MTTETRPPAPDPAPVPLSVREAAETSPRAEAIRLELADAWGRMGAAWGVPPAVTRVHAYLMSRRAPLTEREVREALGLSHRAASQALVEAETWGLVERVAEPRRVGRRGPASVAYLAVNDPWRWFGRVVAQRKSREGDPIVAVLERTSVEAARAAAEAPDDPELAELADWLAAFLAFVRLFDRTVGLVPSLEPRQLERALVLLDRVDDEAILRLIRILDALEDDEVLGLVDAVSRLPPSSARRTAGMVAGVIRATGRATGVR